MIEEQRANQMNLNAPQTLGEMAARTRDLQCRISARNIIFGYSQV